MPLDITWTWKVQHEAFFFLCASVEKVPKQVEQTEKSICHTEVTEHMV